MKKAAPMLLLTAAGIFSGNSLAGTLTSGTNIHSKEGVANDNTMKIIAAPVYKLGAAYAVGDKLTFIMNEDIVSNSPFPSSISAEAVNSDDADAAIAGVAFGLLSQDSTSVTYRVTSITQPTDIGGTAYTDKTTLGAEVTFIELCYTLVSLNAGDVIVKASSSTSDGDALDTDAQTIIATTKSQFDTGTVSSKFDAVIDVGAVRKAFTSSTGTNDMVSWSITNPDTTGWQDVATMTSTDVTIKGESGKLTGLDSSQFTVGNGGTVTYSSESDSVAIAYTGDVTSDTLTFTPPTDDNAVVLNAQSFMADIKYTYNDGGGTATTHTVIENGNAGAWTINGANVVIPYMPYSDNASQIIYVHNNGTQSGDITVTAKDSDGNSYDLGVLATAGGGQLIKMATLIKNALASKGFSSGKLTLTVTVEVPENDVIVYASYNVGGADRGFVQTDQMINKSTD